MLGSSTARALSGGTSSRATTGESRRPKPSGAKTVYGCTPANGERFPHEMPFVYRPHSEAGLSYRWDAAARATMKGYNRLDLSI
jgi:hypothetical protein